MNLLEFAKDTVEQMDKVASKDFSKFFIERKSICFHEYQNDFVTSNSHGISFFDNVIKFWDNPDSYYTPKKDKGYYEKSDYELNFIKILKHNKNQHNEK